VNIANLNKQVKDFKELYRTERNFNPDSMIVKNVNETIFDNRSYYDGDNAKNVIFNNSSK
jgi:hypothetical protein